MVLLGYTSPAYVTFAEQSNCSFVSAVVVFVDRLLLAVPPLAAEDAHISFPEGGVTVGVAEGVDGRVDVAEAVGDVPDQLGDELLQIAAVQLDVNRKSNLFFFFNSIIEFRVKLRYELCLKP